MAYGLSRSPMVRTTRAGRKSLVKRFCKNGPPTLLSRGTRERACLTKRACLTSSRMSDGARSPRPPLVLIANDQEWAARSLETILGPNGYAVLRAYTGRQAVELAHSAQPDAVILEIRMPDMDGLEVCQRLRDDPRASP